MEFLGHVPLLVTPEKSKQKHALGLCLLAMGGCQKSTICVFSLGKNRVLLALDVSSVALKTPPICTTAEY